MLSQHQEKLERIFRTFVICLISFLPLNQAVNYDGYKLYRLYPDTLEKIALLKSLDGVTGYDFWQGPSGNITELMVAPKEQRNFEYFIASVGIRRNIAINDVAEKVRENEMVRRSQLIKKINARRGGNFKTDENNFPIDRYLRYEEMLKLVKSMAEENPRAKFFEFGRTFEGRQMFGVKLSTSDKNPVILIDGGIHAREWAAPMSVLYVLRSLMNDEEVIKRLTFYIIPLLNADGYEYSQTRDRLWRKTMSRQGLSKCFGVDGNRNFNSHWNEAGGDTQPCSSIYAGPKPFSEPESKALRNLILKTEPVMYLTFHSYGGLILYPWGFTSELPSNWKELDMLGKKAATAIKKEFQTNYVVGSSTNVLYPASGGSDDWAMEKAGVPLVFCIELEDYGSRFDLPTEKLYEIMRHADTIVKVFVDYVKDNYTS